MTEVECSDTVIVYHRRNDRTPEKDFEKRDETNKILACEVRRAVERARNKITNLEDDVDERDAVIETERSLRIAAENRLQEHLVDPYNSPEVNHELRQRLPRAKKEDPKLKQVDTSLHDNTEDEIEEVCEVMETQQVTQTERPPSPDQVGPNKSLSQVKRILDFNVNSKPSEPAKSSHVKTNLPFSNSNIVGFPQYVNMPQTPMLYKPGLTSAFSPSGAYSYNLTSPRNPVRTPLNTSNVQNNAQQDDQSEKMDTSLSVSELQTEELPPHEPVQQQQQSFLRLPSHTMNGYPSPIRSSFLTHSSPVYQPTSLSESVLPSYNSQLSISDQTRQVALLLSELDAAKCQNKKLMDKVINMEMDLETEKLKAKVREADEKGHSDASVAAGLVQEVHKAQRRKEEAMMGRIKVANQERDESMFRLSEMERRFEESFGRDNRSDDGDIDDELDLQEGFEHLLSRVGQYDFPSVQEYTALVQKLEQTKQRQREVTADEMQAILEQRDMAMAKARKLEEELMKRQREETFNNSNAEQNLHAELAIVKQERELALAKVRQLKDENETIRIYYSLHKSLSQESIHQNNNTLHINQSKLKGKENNTLVAELQAVSIERDQLQTDLEKRDKKLEETHGQVKKLERLVTVLRKKVKGADHSSED